MTASRAGSGLCRNCGTPAPSNFCPYCGQSTAQHVLSVFEFVHEIVSHYMAVEGKLWRTLALLALQPGRLTREFLVGRRERYIVPLRVYLTASFLFFAVSQWLGQPVDVLVVRPGAPVPVAGVATQPGATTALASGAPADSASSASARDQTSRAAPPEVVPAPAREPFHLVEVDADEGARLDEALGQAQAKLCGGFAAGACPWWRRLPALAAANLQRDPAHVTERFAERFRHSLSYAMFFLLPVFASLLALVYANRAMYYGEHLVFALHVHSFWYLTSFLFFALPDAMEPMLPLCFFAYGSLALRRVYGGRWVPTLLRGVVVATLYGIAIGLGAAVLSIVLLAT